MALRESNHACRGRLGVSTKKEEEVRDLPRQGKKKRKRKKRGRYGFVAPRFTGKKRERPFEELWLRGFPPHPKKKNKKKNTKKSKKSNKTISVRTVSRTHIPRERVNQKESD